MPPSAPSDEALLAGLGSGDADAAATFVRRFQGRVYGLAFTLVGDAQTAQDIAQEAFMRAWRHAGSYDPRRGRVATWLLAITRNLAIDAARLKAPDPIDPEIVDARADGSAHAGSGFEERHQLRAAIAELPRDQRRPLVLAVYLGRTGSEIAELDGVPLGTVKTRIRTALVRLRAALEVSGEL